MPRERPRSAADRLIPDDIRELLGPPPLARGEDLDRYERIFAQIAASLQPTNVIDWFRCREIVNLTWKLQRLARIEAALLSCHEREALLDALAALRGSEKPISPSLVGRWAQGEPQARREIADMLAEYGADADVVLAQAVVKRLGIFVGLDHMATIARSQRERLMADIKRARAETHAGPLRHGSRELDDIEFDAPR